MKLQKIIISLILLFIALPAFADVYDYPVKLANIYSRLPQIKNLKCTFKQEKYLQNISKPVISGGDFEFIEGKGVYFHTTYPIKSTADYTNKNYKQINEVVKAVSTKKYSGLEKEFSFFYTDNADFWTLGMKPKEQSSAGNVISSITVTGTDYINQIDIEQTNGNKTKIWFQK